MSKSSKSSKSKSDHKCPTCGHVIEKKSAKSAEKKTLNPSDLVVYDASIYWRIEDELTNLGACMGDGLSTALSSRTKVLVKSADFYAVELYAAILSPKIKAERNYKGEWEFSSDSAASKGRTEIVKAVNLFLSREDLEEAFKDAVAAAKKALESEGEEE